MKHPVFLIVSICLIVLVSGTSIAYYNTRSFGFDEDASIIKYDDESVKIYDYDIYYKDVKEIIERVKERIPKDSITVYIML